MASGYKVRIADGSEIGPLDLAAVKEWYAQGLITKDSAVLKPGSTRWSTLGQVLELKNLGGSSSRKAAAAPATARPGRPGPAASTAASTASSFDPDLWRIRAPGALFLLAALAVGTFYLHPENAVPDLDGAPWLEIALALLVLAMALLPGRDIGRKGVRVATAVASMALFPVMGILFAQGVRGAALLAVASAWLVFSGLFALLSPSLSWGRLAVSLLPLLAGVYGAYRFGYAPETAAQRTVREWAVADRRFADDTLGLGFEAPRGWVILKKDNPLVKAPPETRLVLAQPRTGGFGYLVEENAPRGISTLDQYLDRVVAARKKAVPSLKELGRTDVMVGRVSGRQAAASWDDAGVRQRDVTVAWKDGWVYFALAAWIPEEGAQRPKALEALVPAFSTQGVLAARLLQSVQKVTQEVPQLTTTAAETLMAGSEAKVLEPDQAFRRSLDALVRALPALSKAETQDLSQLTTATYGVLAGKDRVRLSAYFDRVRGREATSPQEDREMCQLMKVAVLKLPALRRLRLQALYEKAISTS